MANQDAPSLASVQTARDAWNAIRTTDASVSDKERARVAYIKAARQYADAMGQP